MKSGSKSNDYNTLKSGAKSYDYNTIKSGSKSYEYNTIKSEEKSYDYDRIKSGVKSYDYNRIKEGQNPTINYIRRILTRTMGLLLEFYIAGQNSSNRSFSCKDQCVFFRKGQG